MTDREKLIELLLAGMGFTDNKQLLIPTSELYHLADYLISHGVVVRDKGEWIELHSLYIQDGAHKRQCSCCKKSTTNLGEPLGFCPNCGADMRKREDIK